MRGKGSKSSVDAGKYRITPAYAGKSHLYGIIAIEVRDHPRLCGEKANKTIKTANAEGSPPPMRGKAIDFSFGVVEDRITPAYAGKSQK